MGAEHASPLLRNVETLKQGAYFHVFATPCVPVKTPDAVISQRLPEKIAEEIRTNLELS